VAAAAHRDEQVALARVVQRGHDVGNARAARDERGPSAPAPFHTLRASS
jgi:hypothetical protein